MSIDRTNPYPNLVRRPMFASAGASQRRAKGANLEPVRQSQSHDAAELAALRLKVSQLETEVSHLRTEIATRDEVAALAGKKPWEAAGVSKATWYRLRTKIPN